MNLFCSVFDVVLDQAPLGSLNLRVKLAKTTLNNHQEKVAKGKKKDGELAEWKYAEAFRFFVASFGKGIGIL